MSTRSLNTSSFSGMMKDLRQTKKLQEGFTKKLLSQDLTMYFNNKEQKQRIFSRKLNQSMSLVGNELHTARTQRPFSSRLSSSNRNDDLTNLQSPVSFEKPQP